MTTDDRRAPSFGFLRPPQIAALRETLCGDLARHPEWPDLWNSHGMLEAWEGRLDRAAESFRHALERNPGYGTARWNLRWVEALGGRAQSAPPPPPAHGTTAPHQPESLLALVRNRNAGVTGWAPEADAAPGPLFFALAAAADAGPGEALDGALRRLRASMATSSELLAMADLVHADGTLRTARLAEAARAARINPDAAGLFRRVAGSEERNGRPAEARRLLALAALYDGNAAAFHVDLAGIEGRAGRNAEAIRRLERAAAEAPEWVEPRVRLGFEHSAAGSPEAALPCLERAAALRPGWPDLLYQLALVQHALGRNSEAVSTLEGTVAMRPDYLVARIALANLLFECRRGHEAAPHYERILDEGLATPTLVGRFGYAMHAAGARNRAEEIFLEAIARDPSRPEILALYGLFLAETNRRLEARAVWDRALAAGPAPDVRERIEEMRIDVAVEERGGDA